MRLVRAHSSITAVSQRMDLDQIKFRMQFGWQMISASLFLSEFTLASIGHAFILSPQSLKRSRLESGVA
jgi:hypothetical protein